MAHAGLIRTIVRSYCASLLLAGLLAGAGDAQITVTPPPGSGGPAGDKVLDEADGLIDESFLRPAHPHTLTQGPPGAGSCLLPGEVVTDAFAATAATYRCVEPGGNPQLIDVGDAYNTITNGTTAVSATGSATLQFPSTTALSGTNPVVVAIPEARATFDFACSDTATTPEYLLATAGRLATGCVASGDATDGRYLVTSNLRLQNLRCQAPAGPDTGQTWTMTVQDTGIDTALVCTMTNPATTCAQTAQTHNADAGDRLSIKKDDSSAFDGAGVRCAFEGVYR